jgi:hypothetical protein
VAFWLLKKASSFPFWRGCCASGWSPQARKTVSQGEPSVLGAATLCGPHPASLLAAMTGMRGSGRTCLLSPLSPTGVHQHGGTDIQDEFDFCY